MADTPKSPPKRTRKQASSSTSSSSGEQNPPANEAAAPAREGSQALDHALAATGARAEELSDLKGALLAAASEFATDARPLSELITAMVADVEHAAAERLEIFPVAHHSPASAVHMVQRLTERAPRIIFMEMCEDLIAPVPDLADSTLPVALQAFAGISPAFPAAWQPLSVVAPITELSAEYQAIAYALSHPSTELIFIDRSVDHVFQALPQREDGIEEALPDSEQEDEDDEGSALHGSAIGVEIGSLVPSFGEFLDVLLANARVSHFSEWWSLYVEQPTLGRSYDVYRRVMFLVGSLIRRLGSTAETLASDRMRERYMWTRMKEHLQRLGAAPEDAIYICGAAHTVAEVPEFGSGNDTRWDIPPRTATEWLYGLIPSSYSAIEYQFSHPRGTVSLAAETWHKAVSGLGLKPFKLARPDSGKAAKPTKRAKASGGKGAAGKATGPEADPAADAALAMALANQGLVSVLTQPPALAEEDKEQLLGWCVEIVALARKNGYLASTADAIAIYQHAVLLANLRARRHPSPGDFTDAAITCLEKTSVPGKRSVARLCEMLLGADKIGQVGYSSLPPLVQDVYDRLAIIGVTPKKTTVTRALMDFTAKPELRACSDLLWRLAYLLPGGKVARPIMGERVLGGTAKQESWDVKLAGTEQREVIQLAYEGVTVEQVLEKRLHTRAHAAQATTVHALEVVEDSILLLSSQRLTEELGKRAVHLLTGGLGVDDAQEVFDRVRRLVHYYRATPGGLPHWLKDFVVTGYQHYATLLPEAFSDRGTKPEQVAGMLAFIFTLESLALTLGCSRSQLIIAIDQAALVTEAPDKLGLLWAAELLIGRKDEDAVRAAFAAIAENPMSLSAYPAYLGGLLLALGFTTRVASLGVELLSRAFATLPDTMLMPWLPGLIDTLKPRAGDIMPALLKEAQILLPKNLAGLDSWRAPWHDRAPAPAAAAPAVAQATPAIELSADERGARSLVFAERSAADAWASLLGMTDTWGEAEPTATAAPGPSAPSAPSASSPSAGASATAAASPAEQGAAALLKAHPAALEAYAQLTGSRLP